MNIRNCKTIKERRELMEKECGISLSHTGQYSLDETIASTRNCENMIGATQVPLGIAGPLLVASVNLRFRKKIYIPLATTEGALVASVNRGCKAMTESGGALTDSHRVGATRGPVFRVANLQESDVLYTFLKEHLQDLQRVAKQTSHHLTLIKLLPRGVGHYRFVRFVFDTKDAMGMNMVTIATQALVDYIQEQTGVSCISIAGNFDIDKKPSWLNAIENRGTKVWAEATLSHEVLQQTLKTTAKRMYDVWLAKCMVGSALSGSLGFNAQFANIVASLFLATGQDLGHVGEGSIGITTMEIIEKQKTESLYVSVCLPDLMVGTVGGGTGLATQKEALSILGVAGSTVGEDGKNAETFAELVGAAVLAGEISLIASLSEGTLAKAHQSLARGKGRYFSENSENRNVGKSENQRIGNF